MSILTKTAKFFDFKTRILIEKLSVVIENYGMSCFLCITIMHPVHLSKLGHFLA